MGDKARAIIKSYGLFFRPADHHPQNLCHCCPRRLVVPSGHAELAGITTVLLLVLCTPIAWWLAHTPRAGAAR